MRIILGVLAIILLTAPVGTAQYGQMMGGLPSGRSKSDSKETLTGFLLDRPCASHATMLSSAGASQSPECLLRGQKAGLGVVSRGKWIPFDEKGSKKAVDLLKSLTATKGVIVSVEGRMKGDVFAVSNIKRIEP